MDAIKVTKCRGCGSSNLESIDTLGNFPYANTFPSKAPTAWLSNRLALTVCRDCNLCQLDEYPNLHDLYADYIWVTNSSSFIHEYLDELKDRLLSLSADKYQKVVEIASNDATFLRKFEGYADQLIGVEPAKNLSSYYSEANISLISDFFSSKCVEQNKELLSKSSLIIARNVLGHVPDISNFLNACKTCLSPQGVIYLEFHDGDEIINKLQFDSIYHEHQSYITEKALKLILEKHGLKVDASWLGPIGGSSRSVVVSHLDESKIDTIEPHEINTNDSSSITEIRRWRAFRGNLDEYKVTLENMLADAWSKNLTIVAYGASARSTTLAGFCNLSQWLAAIVDSASEKRGRVWTGSDLIVKSPYELDWTNVDIVVLLAWNFQQEIVEKLADLGFKGKILRVLPGKPDYIN